MQPNETLLDQQCVVWTGVLASFDPKAKGFGPELPLDQRVSAPITIEVPQ